MRQNWKIEGHKNIHNMFKRFINVKLVHRLQLAISRLTFIPCYFSLSSLNIPGPNEQKKNAIHIWTLFHKLCTFYSNNNHMRGKKFRWGAIVALAFCMWVCICVSKCFPKPEKRYKKFRCKYEEKMKLRIREKNFNDGLFSIYSLLPFSLPTFISSIYLIGFHQNHFRR